MDAVTAFAAELAAQAQRDLAEARGLRTRLAKLKDDLVDLRDADVNAAWHQIERAADAVVAKSVKALSREQAIDTALQRDPGLYHAYESALAERIAKGEAAEQRRARDDLRELAEAAILTRVLKAARGGLSGDEALERVLRDDPQLAEAAGVELPEPIEKAGNGEWAAIEAGAAALVRKSAGELSTPRAVDAFLQTQEGRSLYRRYSARQQEAQMRAVGMVRPEDDEDEGEVEQRAKPDYTASVDAGVAMSRAHRAFLEEMSTPQPKRPAGVLKHARSRVAKAAEPVLTAADRVADALTALMIGEED